MVRKRIAIQGFNGSFHEVAARKFWSSDIEIIPCATFREVFRHAANPEVCEGAVVAIENSIAGSILPNYNLLKQSDLVVTGEVFLEIRQQLIVLEGTRFEDIREIHSHPMAILQCLDFIDQQPHWKVVEAEDTALSAARIAQNRLGHVAAIASERAASIYGLHCIRKDIQTMKNNYTRFLILERPHSALTPQIANKASIYFDVRNEVGGLMRVLQILAEYGLNLSKLQSFPIPGSSWLYGFHADIEFSDPGTLEEALGHIDRYTREVRVYGQYAKGISVENEKITNGVL